MNLGQAIYLDEDNRVRYRPTFIRSVLAIEARRSPVMAYVALKPPAYFTPPKHRNGEMK